GDIRDDPGGRLGDAEGGRARGGSNGVVAGVAGGQRVGTGLQTGRELHGGGAIGQRAGGEDAGALEDLDLTGRGGALGGDVHRRGRSLAVARAGHRQVDRGCRAVVEGDRRGRLVEGLLRSAARVGEDPVVAVRDRARFVV